MSRGKHYVKIDETGLVNVIIFYEKFNKKYYEENGFILKEIPDDTGHEGHSLYLNDETGELEYRTPAVIPAEQEPEEIDPESLEPEERIKHLEHAIDEMATIQFKVQTKMKSMQDELNILKGSEN